MPVNDPEQDDNQQPPYWLAFMAFWTGIAVGVLVDAWEDVKQWWNRS